MDFQMAANDNALTQPKFDLGFCVIKKKITKLWPPTTYTKWPKSWGYVDFKMAANENALTQPKFDLGICGIIQNVFQGD